MRLMVHPSPKFSKKQQYTPQRKTYQDLLKEIRYKVQTQSSSLVPDDAKDWELSPEEYEEIRRYNMMQVYKRAGYMRFYMLLFCSIGGMGLYLNFRKNKRKPLNNLEICQRVKTMVRENKDIMHQLQGKLIFDETVIGAIVNERADFQIRFAGYGFSG